MRSYFANDYWNHVSTMQYFTDITYASFNILYKFKNIKINPYWLAFPVIPKLEDIFTTLQNSINAKHKLPII